MMMCRCRPAHETEVIKKMCIRCFCQLKPVAVDMVKIMNNSFSYCKSALCALYATRCFVFLQEETSQEMSAMQETRRLEEVNDSEMEIVTVVIFLEIAFILVCLILF